MEIKDFIGKASYDNEGAFIWAIDQKGGMQKLADLRGFGAIQQLFKNKKGEIDIRKSVLFQDELGQFIVDAINEKLNK
jgi:hypothetical protein